MVNDHIVRICASGNKNGVSELIEDSENQNKLIDKVLLGKTPIEIATCFGHLDIVEELIKSGIEINYTSQSGL